MPTASGDPWARSTSYRRSLTGARRPTTSPGLSHTSKDALRVQYTNKDDYSDNKLNTELCDMALLKLEIHGHLLGTFLDAHPFVPDDKTRARTVLATHTSVRKFMHAYPDDPPPRTT